LSIVRPTKQGIVSGGPDLDGKDDLEGNEYDRSIIVSIPSGGHVICIENTGLNWLSIDEITFTGMQQ
jgi:hypothetical protein